MRWIRDWVTSIMTLAAFGYVLVKGEIMGRLALRRSMDAYEASVGRLQYDLIRAFRLSGVEVAVEGVDRVHGRRGYIFVSNHQSMFDIPIFGGILRDHKARYVAKRSLAKRIPSVSLYLNRGGNAVIDRGDPAQAVEAITRMGQMCQERDVAAVIFPEGTRSRDGSLGGYRTTGLAALMAAAPDLPIVPTVIDGSWQVFEHNMLPVPYGVGVRVRFGDPIPRSPTLDADDVVGICTTFAEETLAEWRKV